MNIGTNNTGTQWVHDNKITTIHIHKLVISGSPGNYKVEYTPSLFEKIKSIFGFGPDRGLIEFYARTKMLGESPEIAIKQIVQKEKP